MAEPQGKKDKSIPVGTICQWCYNPIEKGDTYTKDSIYGYVHNDDNEFCIRTQEKVDKELERLRPTTTTLPSKGDFRVPFQIQDCMKEFFDLIKKG